MKDKLSVMFKIIRPHHIYKNLLIFFPLFLTFYPSLDIYISNFLLLAFSFFSFTLITWIVYITNDLVDQRSDSMHFKKKFRPIASGDLNNAQAIFIIIFLASVFYLTLLSFNPKSYLAVILVYVLINFLYSVLGFKRIPILEMVIVASGYPIRILLGVTTLNEQISSWFFFITMSFAIGLIASKRYAEKMNSASNPLSSPRDVLSSYSQYFLLSFILLSFISSFISYLIYSQSLDVIDRYGANIFISAFFFLMIITEYLRVFFLNSATYSEDPVRLFINTRSLNLVIFLYLLSIISIYNFL